jgi:uncharacterized membrane protein YeaQ/YmgE (transglycosylase-associated protein family)
MNILAWILFGMIVGIVAGAIDDVRRGLFTYILLGVGGSLFGGFAANYIFNTGFSGFNATAFLLASFGAVVLLFLGRTLRRI